MLEVMDVVDTGRRRRFSREEKARIVEESYAGPNMARATARRYGIAISGLYQWRQQYKRGAFGGQQVTFRPVEVISRGSATPSIEAMHGAHSRIEIAFPNGRRLFVPVDTSASSLGHLIQVVERA